MHVYEQRFHIKRSPDLSFWFDSRECVHKTGSIFLFESSQVSSNRLQHFGRESSQFMLRCIYHKYYWPHGNVYFVYFRYSTHSCYCRTAGTEFVEFELINEYCLQSPRDTNNSIRLAYCLWIFIRSIHPLNVLTALFHSIPEWSMYECQHSRFTKWILRWNRIGLSHVKCHLVNNNDHFYDWHAIKFSEMSKRIIELRNTKWIERSIRFTRQCVCGLPQIRLTLTTDNRITVCVHTSWRYDSYKLCQIRWSRRVNTPTSREAGQWQIIWIRGDVCCWVYMNRWTPGLV